MNNCIICQKSYSGWGNSADPVVVGEDNRCCDDCNTNIVIPRRLEANALGLPMRFGSPDIKLDK